MSLTRGNWAQTINKEKTMITREDISKLLEQSTGMSLDELPHLEQHVRVIVAANEVSTPKEREDISVKLQRWQESLIAQGQTDVLFHEIASKTLQYTAEVKRIKKSELDKLIAQHLTATSTPVEPKETEETLLERQVASNKDASPESDDRSKKEKPSTRISAPVIDKLLTELSAATKSESPQSPDSKDMLVLDELKNLQVFFRLTNIELVKRTGLRANTISNILRKRENINPELKTLAAIAKVFGKRISIVDIDTPVNPSSSSDSQDYIFLWKLYQMLKIFFEANKPSTEVEDNKNIL